MFVSLCVYIYLHTSGGIVIVKAEFRYLEVYWLLYLPLLLTFVSPRDSNFFSVPRRYLRDGDFCYPGNQAAAWKMNSRSLLMD